MVAVLEEAPLGWHCYPNFLVCRHEHLLRYDKHVANLDGVSGHAFFRCNQCKPATYFFVVISTTPDSHAECYAIDEASFRAWEADVGDKTCSTPEMLYKLRGPDGQSLNPKWRPMR
jgi:hypothetical protein